MSATTYCPPPESPFAAVKTKQQAMWASGDFAVVGTTLQIVGESLCEALDLRAGSRVLDVAAGNGNAALAASRRWCDVVATDYVPALLERARERAAANRLPLATQFADAEALPFDDESFDVVVSTYGVMFAPDHRKSASELLRVCRKRGKIGLASWTPEGFIGQLFKVVGKHVAPPPGVASPALWGTDSHLQELFAHGASIQSTAKDFVFRYRSPEHWIAVFRGTYGPVLKAFDALDAAKQDALTTDLTELIARFNRSGGADVVVPGQYLETVITKR